MLQNQPSLDSLSLEKLIDRNPLTVAPDTPLVEVINLMSQTWASSCPLPEGDTASSESLAASVHTSCALVMERDLVVGIFTERDLVRLVAAGRKLEEGMTVAEVMTQEVMTLKATEITDVFAAVRLLRKHHIRHLPIVNDRAQLRCASGDRVLGLVTPSVVRRGLQPSYLLRLRRVDEVMSTQVIHAPTTASVLHLAQLMTQHQVSCVVIVENAQLPQNSKLTPVGIITERDIVQFQMLELNLEAVQALSVMSAPLFLLSRSDSLWTVQQQMQQRRVRRLVVAGSEGQLEGIVTQTSLLRTLDPVEMLDEIGELQQILEAQTIELRESNQRLQQEIQERETLSAADREANRALGREVESQTADIEQGSESVQQTDKALQTTTKRLSTIVKNLQAGILVEDESRQVLLVNPLFCQLFGMEAPPEALIGTDCKRGAEAVKGLFADPEGFIKGITQLLQSQRTVTGEELLLADGRTFDRDYIPLFIENDYRGNLWIYRDISEKKQGQEKLIRQALIFESMSDGVILTDLEGSIIDWNRAAERMFGYTKAEVLGKSSGILHKPEESATLTKKIIDGMTSNGGWSGEITFIGKDGRSGICETVVVPLRDRQGQVVATIGLNHDITERKQAEEALRQKTKALENFSTSLKHLHRIATTNYDNFDDLFADYLETGCAIFGLETGVIGQITDHSYTIESVRSDFEFLQPGLELPLEHTYCATVARENKTIAYSNVGKIVSMQTHPLYQRLKLESYISAPIFVDGEMKLTLSFCSTQVRSSDFQPQEREIIELMATSIGRYIERQRAEEAHRISSERLQLALEGSGEGLWDWNIRTGEVYLGPRWLEMLGYGLDDLPGDVSTWERSIHPEDKPWVMELLNAHLKDSSVPYAFDYRLLTKSGEYKWIANYGKVVARDEHGKPLRMAGTHRDITERKLAEQKIRQQAALLDVTKDAILVRGESNEILFWNKGAERLYGYLAEEAIGQDADGLLLEESLPQWEEITEALASFGEWQGELYQVTKAGKKIIVESCWTVVENEAGTPKSILVVNTDITEKKQLEAQFLRAQRLESLGTLASGIAHDLNNILTPILTAAQLLQSRFPDADKRTHKLLKTQEINVKRGAALVKQVLSFSRGMSGKRTVLQVSYLLKEIEQIVLETFPKSIEVRINIPKGLWLVNGDVTQLHQIMMNLCVNALDAMIPKGGVLNISAENLLVDENYARINLEAGVGPYVVITVSDTGIGIPPEILDRIFEPFFTTKEVGKGTGLGLSTLIGIIKGHGGFVNVSSKVGFGTEFKVFLPGVEATVAPSVENRELPLGNRELILVVDDEATIREITKTSLETYGYKVLTANNGLEAIALYREHFDDIGVVLMDMIMPEMDGATAIPRLQKINPHVKIIASSGLVCDNKITDLGTGVKAFLSKPHTSEELLKTINEVLNVQQI